MDPTPYYGPYRVVETTISLAGGVSKPVAAENFNRVGLLIGSGSGVSFNVSTVNPATQNSGFLISGTNPLQLQLAFSDFGPLLGLAWFGFSVGAGECTVIEVIRDREIGERWQLIPELQSAEHEPEAAYDPVGQQYGSGALQH